MMFFQVLLPLVAPIIDVFALHGLLTGRARSSSPPELRDRGMSEKWDIWADTIRCGTHRA
jgi:hypothetical protein